MMGFRAELSGSAIHVINQSRVPSISHDMSFSGVVMHIRGAMMYRELRTQKRTERIKTVVAASRKAVSPGVVSWFFFAKSMRVTTLQRKTRTKRRKRFAESRT